MSNVAGKAYAMNVVTPIRPRRTWVNALIFMMARVMPSTLAGLLGLSLIHFARWVIVPRNQWPQLGQPQGAVNNDYMLFISNFNGTWDQYIDAFSDGLPNGLDLFWYSSTKYPHSIPITAFKNYIRDNQVDTDYYYNATPDAAQRDIKAASRVRAVLRTLANAHPTITSDAFVPIYRAALASVQNDLGSLGLAPVASNDTANADRHRQPYVERRWPAGKAAHAQ